MIKGIFFLRPRYVLLILCFPWALGQAQEKARSPRASPRYCITKGHRMDLGCQCLRTKSCLRVDPRKMDLSDPSVKTVHDILKGHYKTINKISHGQVKSVYKKAIQSPENFTKQHSKSEKISQGLLKKLNRKVRSKGGRPLPSGEASVRKLANALKKMPNFQAFAKRQKTFFNSQSLSPISFQEEAKQAKRKSGHPLALQRSPKKGTGPSLSLPEGHHYEAHDIHPDSSRGLFEIISKRYFISIGEKLLQSP